MTSPRYDDFWATMDPDGVVRSRFAVTDRPSPDWWVNSLPPAEQERHRIFAFALWWIRNETPADCARRAIRDVPQGMTLAHCDHVASLPGFFCRACKAGTPLRATEWV